MDPVLERYARDLEATGWAAELCDAEWRLVWASGQLKGIMGEHDDEALGVGLHVLDARRQPIWGASFSMEASRAWTAVNVRPMLADAPGGKEAILARAAPELRDIVLAAEPAAWPAWTQRLDFSAQGNPLGSVRYFGMRARGPDGRAVCTIYLYGSTLPAQLLALVARGSAEMYERVARLVKPGRRAAAVLFADIQASTRLSRHLPSATYFALIRDLVTTMDEAVIAGRGIVGRHGGDGLVAFFLTDDLGSPSTVARSALEAARDLAHRARLVSQDFDLRGDDAVRLNVGVHWGDTLYMGQVVTGGRLEVTALGDEVNETARIQEAAREGIVLASKSLIERLDAGDADRAGIDPDAVVYRALAELPDATEKIVRDAGTIAVTVIEA